MRQVLKAFLLCACALGTTGPQAADGQFVDNKVVLSQKGRDGVSIEFSITRAAWQLSHAYGTSGYWGAATKRPRSVITNLAGTVNGESAYIPLSAYVDLAEPSEASLSKDGPDWTIEILGGSGADAYAAVLTFDSAGWILRRRVHSIEMASDVWEETRYSFMKSN